MNLRVCLSLLRLLKVLIELLIEFFLAFKGVVLILKDNPKFFFLLTIVDFYGRISYTRSSFIGEALASKKVLLVK